MRAKSAPPTDVGVIVGRFHVPMLHEGHLDLYRHVLSQHKKVIVFLGLSPLKATRMNPLDFEARKQMILEDFPEVNVLYIKDQRCDKVWSRKLDEQIRDITGPTQTVCLYGSRDSFVKHYHGKFPTIELEQETFQSGTVIRNEIRNLVKGCREFRDGVVWTVYNQYPKVYPTVDIAIWDENCEKLLLARKPSETEYRFVGGFVDPRESYEKAAGREVLEETHLEVDKVSYVGSAPIDDWRYRREEDSITTVLFETKRLFGSPIPDDDISELRWFEVKTLKNSQLVEEHHVLIDMLRDKYPERFA